jgi:ATP-dependent RNA helicase RhlE
VTFATFGLPVPILKGIRAAGLTEPTAIQSKAIPIILQGNDVIGVAESGSGKTGAYLIPILSRFLDRSVRLRGIILVPTRELAAYVETRTRDYARFTDLKPGLVFTGAPLAQQERLLREQPFHLLVATPGRLLELHARGVLNFADVEILVIEEADRMVGLGLAPDVRKLLKLLPETRQTLLFTLTMPPELNRLAKEALVEPVRVDVAPATAKPAAGITQAIYPVARELKIDLLEDLLSRNEVRSTIIFTRHRTAAERLGRQLQRHGHALALLDEHPNQGERERAMDDLRRGRVQILVASEAAGRSLDVAGTAHVVNFDVPQTPEDYVHRLGRGGRADPVGDAFTLMSPDEQREVGAIEQFLGRAIPRVMLPDFDYGMTPGEHRAPASFEPVEERRAPAGVAAAAARIAANGNNNHKRPVASANGTVAPARKPAPREEPRPSARRRPVTAAKSTAKPRRPAHRGPAKSPARGSRAKAPAKTAARGRR